MIEYFLVALIHNIDVYLHQEYITLIDQIMITRSKLGG